MSVAVLLDQLGDAACRSAPLEWFFPGRSGMAVALEAARHVCAGCRVVDVCRRYGDRVERDELPSRIHGLLAGETPAERVARRTQVA